LGLVVTAMSVVVGDDTHGGADGGVGGHRQEGLDDLRRLLGANAGAHLTTANAALDRFKAIHTEIITLSRRNSEVARWRCPSGGSVW
jgi:hypothetical protein